MGTLPRNASSTLPEPASARASAAMPAMEAEQWVDRHGDFLYAYAMVRLRDPVQAQDVVQETFVAALKGRSRCRGEAGERGWLVGILKHKIVDLFRSHSRETSFTDMGFYEEEESDRFGKRGLHEGAWIHALGPAHWSTRPEQTLERKEFWETLYRCTSKLPENVAKVFLMREVDGIPCAEICSALAVSENNLWVMLHRARMALRRCLETHWFGTAPSRQRGPAPNDRKRR